MDVFPGKFSAPFETFCAVARSDINNTAGVAQVDKAPWRGKFHFFNDASSSSMKKLMPSIGESSGRG